MCQDYTFTQATRARAPQNLRPQAGDCTLPDQKGKLCKHVENNFFIEKKKRIKEEIK